MTQEIKLLLTICIPTLNRAERVYSLVQYLGSHVKDRWADKVNIVVSDNFSSDDTQKLLCKSATLGVSIVRRDTFIDTAEDHILQLIDESDAEFLWLLGDDDIPNLNTFDLLLSYLEQDTADIYVFNHSEILMNGDLLTPRMLHINQPYIDMIGRNLPMAAGFISTLSMFSNVVFRRSCMNLETGRELVNLSPIYSHVAWHIISFNDKRARLVNFQLVNHRADFKSINTYFEARHKAKKQSNYYIWTTGLLLLLQFLLENGYLSSTEVAMIYEHDFNGVRFRLIDRVMHYIYLRLKAAAQDKRSKKSISYNMISEQEMSLFFSTLITCDARIQDQLFVLRKINDEINKENTSWFRCRLLMQKFLSLHTKQVPWHMYATVSVGSLCDYAIFQTITGFVAITNKDNYLLNHREQILNQVDPIEYRGMVLTAGHLDSLLEKIWLQNSLESASQFEESAFVNHARSASETRCLTLFQSFDKLVTLIQRMIAWFIKKARNFIMRRIES